MGWYNVRKICIWKREFTIKKYVLLLTSSVLLFSLLVACNNQQNAGATTSGNNINQETIYNSSAPEQNSSGDISSVFPKSELTDLIAIDSVNEDQSIRAEQQTDQGTLLMVSNGKEERGHLNVSSNAGARGGSNLPQ